MHKRYQADIVLLAIAFVWGATFVVVQNAISSLPPLTFNAVRFIIAALFLYAVILIRKRKNQRSFKDKSIWISGVIIGFWLALGYIFQTFGLLYTSPSKAGFITGLSVVLVPIFALFILRQHLSFKAVFGVVVAALGLYFLTMGNTFSINMGDVLVFFCAIAFALQIVFTGKFASKFDALTLAFVQISTVAIICTVSGLIFEKPFLTGAIQTVIEPHVFWALAVTAIPATALAFLAQTHYQQHTTPTRVALIFATEPVFAALTSYLWVGDILYLKEWIGCILILVGILTTELPIETYLRKLRINKREMKKG